MSSLLLVLLVVATLAAAVRIVDGDDTTGPVGPVPAFAVTVDLDGVVRTVHTTERTATGLMRTLHVGKLVGVRNIPGRLHEGSDVVLRTRHNGILAVDGQTVPFDSASATVDELLVSNNVLLVGEDYTTPSRDAKLVDGETVKVLRVGGETKQTTEVIPFTVEQQADPSTPLGETSSIRAGVDGTLTVTYRERIENGVVVGTTTLSKVRTTDPCRRSTGTARKPTGTGTRSDVRIGREVEHRRSRPGGGLNDGGLGIARVTWIGFGGRESAPNAGPRHA